MKDLLVKFTLYDVIGMFVPGFIFYMCLTSFISFAQNESLIFLKNDWVVISVLSYSFGWFLSEIGKKLFLILEFKKMLIVKYIILIIVLSVVMIYFNQNSCCILIMISSVFMLFSLCFKSNKKKQKGTVVQTEQEMLKEKINFWLKKEICNNENIELKEIPYYIIQTSDKYSRIHNYNSSKSFSKNMSIVCVATMLTCMYHYITGTDYMILLYCGTFASALGIFIFYDRYKMFERKVNFITAVFFADYLKERGAKIKWF